MSKESAKSCRRLEEQGASCLISFLAVGGILRGRYLGCERRCRGGYVSVMGGEPIDDCERFWRAFWGAWAGSFLEGGLRFLL